MNASRFALVLLVIALPKAASADAAFEFLPGSPRAISRSSSASRDTPTLEYAYGPRAQHSVGTDFGLVKVSGDALSGRFGMYGMVCLENHTDKNAFPAHELWRGLIGWSFALSFDRFAERAFGERGALEVAFDLGHESDHHDGFADFGDPPHDGDIPNGGGGDFVGPDVALRVAAFRTLDVTTRLVDRVFVRGALKNAPGAELIVRWRATAWMQPLVSTFGEALVPRPDESKTGGFFRAMVGLAFPGTIGEVIAFTSLDAGNGKGLLINRHETRLSVGVRYAIF